MRVKAKVQPTRRRLGAVKKPMKTKRSFAESVRRRWTWEVLEAL
jgi:hypothetical protein